MRGPDYACANRGYACECPRTRLGAAGVTGDDRLLAPTLWTARLIVPVLVAAWAILYLFPGDTERLWAWPVRPPLTAMVMGAG